MTGLLLDTHAFFWAASEPTRLSPRARQAIEDPANRLVVSAATALEMATKHRRGRWPQVEPHVEGFEAEVATLGGELLDISARHALRAGGMAWDHRDPFDRLLAAQAVIEHLRLVTRDEVFRALPGLDVLW